MMYSTLVLVRVLYLSFFDKNGKNIFFDDK